MAQRQAQEQQRLREQAAFSAHITNIREAVKAEQVREAACNNMWRVQLQSTTSCLPCMTIAPLPAIYASQAL
jgi:hypothetical protein